MMVVAVFATGFCIGVIFMTGYIWANRPERKPVVKTVVQLGCLAWAAAAHAALFELWPESRNHLVALFSGGALALVLSAAVTTVLQIRNEEKENDTR